MADKRDYLLLRRLVAASIEFAKQDKAAADARKPLTNQIKNLLGKYQVGKAVTEEARINYFESGRESIKGDLLLAAGVSPAIIAGATKKTVSYTLKLTAVGEEEE
jgi:hypothetical protein